MTKSYAAAKAYATFLSLRQIILVVDLSEWVLSSRSVAGNGDKMDCSMRSEIGVLFDP